MSFRTNPANTSGGMGPTTHLSVISWLRQQMDSRGLTITDLADRSALPLRLLSCTITPDGADAERLTVRQAFTLARALDTDPVQMITELGMLSDQGMACLPYCADASEAPLGELWAEARHLSHQDRTVLLECVLHRRRCRWEEDAAGSTDGRLSKG